MKRHREIAWVLMKFKENGKSLCEKVARIQRVKDNFAKGNEE